VWRDQELVAKSAQVILPVQHLRSLQEFIEHDRILGVRTL
jgi:hypothetical protein